jgi:hypothetical protein
VEANKLKVAHIIDDLVAGKVEKATVIGMCRAAVCPMPCASCGYLHNVGELTPVECACDWYANHGMKRPFFPQKSVDCGNCSKRRYQNGRFFACICVSRCLEFVKKTSTYWRCDFLLSLISYYPILKLLLPVNAFEDMPSVTTLSSQPRRLLRGVSRLYRFRVVAGGASWTSLTAMQPCSGSFAG